MILYVVRHGQTDYNKECIVQGWIDTELNEKGIDQAQEVARKLQSISFDYIFSSDLKRAYETT